MHVYGQELRKTPSPHIAALSIADYKFNIQSAQCSFRDAYKINTEMSVMRKLSKFAQGNMTQGKAILISYESSTFGWWLKKPADQFLKLARVGCRKAQASHTVGV